MIFHATVEVDDKNGDMHISFEHPEAGKRKPVVTTDVAGKYLFFSGRIPGHITLELDEDERLVGVTLTHFEPQCIEAGDSAA